MVGLGRCYAVAVRQYAGAADLFLLGQATDIWRQWAKDKHRRRVRQRAARKRKSSLRWMFRIWRAEWWVAVNFRVWRSQEFIKINKLLWLVRDRPATTAAQWAALCCRRSTSPGWREPMSAGQWSGPVDLAPGQWCQRTIV